MPGSCFKKDSTDELRVAGCYEHKWKLCSCALNQRFQLLSWYELRIAFWRLHQDEISLVFVQVVISPDRFRLVKDPMSAKVDPDRLFLQDNFQVIDAALSFHHLYTTVWVGESLSDFIEFPLVIKGRDELVLCLGSLGNLVAEHEWTSEKKC